MEKLKLIIAMLIVGSIGIFVHYIPISSTLIATARALIGTIFLFILILLQKKAINWKKVRENSLYLLVSGAFIGFNWIFLFEAYQYTSIAIATLCYYMAPAFVILLAPFVLKEKISGFNLLCSGFAILGAVLISGVLSGGESSLLGIGYGLVAALLYASIMILNKKTKGLSGLELTFFQLLAAAAVMLPYALLTEDISSVSWTSQIIGLLLFVGIVHTGLVYQLFFSAMNKLPTQTSSLLSYIDPITAIFLSAIILNQTLTLIQVLGTLLILGSAISNEFFTQKSNARKSLETISQNIS